MSELSIGEVKEYFKHLMVEIEDEKEEIMIEKLIDRCMNDTLDRQRALINQIVTQEDEENLSDAEKISEENVSLCELEDKFSSLLDLPITIWLGEEKGKIEIEYESIEDLKMIYEKLKGRLKVS